jgi:hypothetical protein
MILNANWLYVNSSAYDKIINMKVDPNNLGTSAFDRFVGDKNQYKTLFIYPFLSIQDNGYSNTIKGVINKDDEYGIMIKHLDKIINKSQNGGRKKRKTKKLKQKGGNKKLIIKSGVWMGFFSNFNKLLTYLVDHPTITKIDYQMKSFGQGSPFSFIKEGEELFSKLFEPYDENKEITETLEKENYDNTRITGPGAANYYNENRTQLQPFHDAYKKYIKIKPEIQKKIDEKINMLKEGSPEQIIGIFIRSDALANEQPTGKMPTREDYKRVLDSIDKTKKTKYFLCIDNNDDLEYYKEHYKPNYYTNIRRSTNNTNGEPHRNTMGTLEELENSFIEVVLLSQCNILLHCLSNMVTASLYMNINQESKFVQAGQQGGNNEKKVIQVYLKDIKTVGASPGFGDIYKGIITLYLLSKELNYQVHIDFSRHPLEKYLLSTIKSEGDINENFNNSVDNLKQYIQKELQIKDILNISTNIYDKNTILSDDDRNKIKDYIKPTDILNSEIIKVKNSLSLNEYICIHIRAGDNELMKQANLPINIAFSPPVDDIFYNKIDIKIDKLLNDLSNNNIDILCVSDSKTLLNHISNKYNKIKLRKDIQPIHLGPLSKDINSLDINTMNTIIDFFLLSTAKKIYAFTNSPGKSGFSYIPSLVYNIPHETDVY